MHSNDNPSSLEKEVRRDERDDASQNPKAWDALYSAGYAPPSCKVSDGISLLIDAQYASAARIEKLEGALRDLLACHDEDVDMDDFADSDSVGSEYAADGKTVVDMKLTFGVLRRARATLNPEETKGGGQ